MKTFASTILFMFLCQLAVVSGIAGQQTIPRKVPGFLGSYHPFKGTAYGGEGWSDGEPIQQAFNFGQNAIISQASYSGYTFAENVRNNCREWDVNKLYGILRPPTEKGVVNQPKDTDPLKPFNIEPGMIQGAHRFSEVSKSCPQLTGVIVDDFFNDYPKLLTAEDVLDIKDALIGKTVDALGHVDHSSPATTPDLKLYIVVYEHQLARPLEETVLSAIDGVSFWTWKQNENFTNFDTNIDAIKRRFPGREVIAGVYVYNGAETPTPESVRHIIGQAVEMYGAGKIDGLLIFAAVWMSREKSSRERWDELGLPGYLGKVYYPFLGEGTGRVIDAKTKKPIARELVTVWRITGGARQLVARKFTDGKGEYRFGGWARGRAEYTIAIGRGRSAQRVKVGLRSGKTVPLPEVRLGR
ncbi:MAG TPA: carboxypeptidase-like regulatory domain-containing protein [Pyrinomonadaceae bacterium]|nr:carboxypeptidase-like regulatory domain-containing protein [Pyrinomonadaceae bacterium]